MKTAELYFEQILVGSLIIAILLLPWLPELAASLSKETVASGIALGALVVGIAFWLGIPFDRFADTLLERLDRHARLQFALDKSKGERFPGNPDDPAKARPYRDLFPEDALRMAGLKLGGAVAAWIDYHRSRIRLARALAVYGPALTLALTLGVTRLFTNWPATLDPIWLVGLAAAYLAWAIAASCGKCLPRTNEFRFGRYAENWNWLDDGQTIVNLRKKFKALRVWGSEWRGLLAQLALLAAAGGIALCSADARAQLAAVLGAGLTAISAWTWWRISHTYRTYLAQIEKLAR